MTTLYFRRLSFSFFPPPFRYSTPTTFTSTAHSSSLISSYFSSNIFATAFIAPSRFSDYLPESLANLSSENFLGKYFRCTQPFVFMPLLDVRENLVQIFMYHSSKIPAFANVSSFQCLMVRDLGRLNIGNRSPDVEKWIFRKSPPFPLICPYRKISPAVIKE